MLKRKKGKIRMIHTHTNFEKIASGFSEDISYKVPGPLILSWFFIFIVVLDSVKLTFTLDCMWNIWEEWSSNSYKSETAIVIHYEKVTFSLPVSGTVVIGLLCGVVLDLSDCCYCFLTRFLYQLCDTGVQCAPDTTCHALAWLTAFVLLEPISVKSLHQ